MLTRRELGRALVGAIVSLGAGATGALWYSRRSRSDRVRLDEEVRRALTVLGSAIGAPVPSPARLADFEKYLSRLPATRELLAGEYLRLHAALARASIAEGIGLSDWRHEKAATAVLNRYYRDLPAGGSSHYAGRVVSPAEVALKDMLLFFAGEPTGSVEYGPSVVSGQGDAAVPVGEATSSFSRHCAACHQSTDVPGLTTDALKTAIDGGPVMSTRVDLRAMDDAEIARVVAFLNR